MFSKYTKLTWASKNLTSLIKRNITVGQNLPSQTLTVIDYKNGKYEKTTATTDDLFGKGKSILVGYPGNKIEYKTLCQ